MLESTMALVAPFGPCGIVMARASGGDMAYQVAGLAIGMIFDELKKQAKGWLDGNPVQRTLTVVNSSRQTASVAVAMTVEGYGISCGWYNVGSGETFARSITVLDSGIDLVLYAQVPGTSLEWGGNTQMAVCRPNAFMIEKPLSRGTARLKSGVGKMDFVGGRAVRVQGDYTFRLS
jgi:hypothetical protein